MGFRKARRCRVSGARRRTSRERRRCRGFTVNDEPYTHNYFGPAGNRPAANVTVLATSMLPPDAPKPEPVSWCIERADTGRGFVIVMPHFYRNWKHEDLRRYLLNGIVWSAKLNVPANGVTARPLNPRQWSRSRARKSPDPMTPGQRRLRRELHPPRAVGFPKSGRKFTIVHYFDSGGCALLPWGAPPQPRGSHSPFPDARRPNRSAGERWQAG